MLLCITSTNAEFFTQIVLILIFNELIPRGAGFGKLEGGRALAF
jgi:hypothetical protein